MRLCKYWAAATAEVPTAGGWSLRCYAGSNESLEEALRNAETIARRAAAAIGSGSRPDSYGYADRPLREEIVDELTRGSETLAIVSRNSYGSLVLNSARALFADIDYPPRTVLESLKRLFVRRRTQAKLDAEIVQRVDRLCAGSPELGVRLYRTANGFRACVTSREYDPRSREAEELLRRFGSDPLYVRLCDGQESFRARLSPKFWRCGGTPPPRRIPWDSPEEERAYREWQRDYERASSGYTTCALVGSFGRQETDPSIAPVVDLHDRLACAGELPLA